METLSPSAAGLGGPRPPRPLAELLGRSLSELTGEIDDAERAHLLRLAAGGGGACSAAAAVAACAATPPDAAAGAGAGCLAADDSDGTPAVPEGPLDLEQLIASIQLQLAHKRELPLRARLKVQQLMRQYDLSLCELDRYSHFDAGKKYTRNLIAADESFTLMLLCW